MTGPPKTAILTGASQGIGAALVKRFSTVKDITDAVMYLTDAATVTGHILYVDGGAHFGRW